MTRGVILRDLGKPRKCDLSYLLSRHLKYFNKSTRDYGYYVRKLDMIRAFRKAFGRAVVAQRRKKWQRARKDAPLEDWQQERLDRLMKRHHSKGLNWKLSHWTRWYYGHHFSFNCYLTDVRRKVAMKLAQSHVFPTL